MKRAGWQHNRWERLPVTKLEVPEHCRETHLGLNRKATKRQLSTLHPEEHAIWYTDIGKIAGS